MSVDAVRQLFVSTYGEEPTFLGVAPGRVNLIGEHTDYNDGFVFPAAIDRCLYIAASPTDGQTELVSGEAGVGLSFDAKAVEVNDLTGWARYPAGIAWAFREKGLPVTNLKAAVVSSVPVGSGVSSSAAIEMAFAVVWRELSGASLTAADLAKIGQRCENGFVGVQSGIMDQMASAGGKEHHAMFLDTRTLETRYAPIPEGLSVVLCDTKKGRSLDSGWYNERTEQCAEAASVLGVKKLRDATPAMVEANKGAMSDVAYRRAKHVTTEDERCLEFVDALASGDLVKVGDLMRASHISLRDDYEVSCPELDAMAEAAWASPGCVGARMTGAGFGGACVALVRTGDLSQFEESVLSKYHKTSGIHGALMACQVVEGARLLVQKG